jgi:hypothetical protein
MSRVALLLITLASVLLGTSPALAQQAAPNDPKPKKVVLPPFGNFSPTPKIIMCLDAEIEMKDFAIPMKFKEVMGQFYEKAAAKGMIVPFLVDQAAFADKNPDAPDIYEVVMKFPTYVKTMSLAKVLDLALAQVPTKDAVYVIRKGIVIITTNEKATVQNLLKERVIGSFDQNPLVNAIYALSDQTGASIVIDPRATEKALTPISATFANDVTLESALMMLTDMADLKMVVVGQGIYVTTPENAAKLTKPANK